MIPLKIVKKLKRCELVAGILSFSILILVFLLSGVISLASDKSVLVCDMYGQYYEFLLSIRHLILERDSLLFSWNLDMGIGIIGWIAYYVASPFNLILLIIPESWMVGGITFLILLKVSLSSVTFVIYIKKVFGIYGIESVLAALCYSLSSYAVGYFFNIMWLDILIWLPLLVWHMKELVDGKSSRRFVFCLVIAFFSNYYVSYMAGVFLFTCFIAYYIFAKGTIFCIEFWKKFMCFVGSAILAFGICGILLIPTMSQMLERLGEGSVDQTEKLLNFNFIDLFQSTTIGNYSSLYHGKPLIYCSCLFAILLILFLSNREVNKKERICFGSLLIIWIAIMLIPQTDLLMHIGNNPTCFPYRYTFVYCFLVSTVGAKQLHYIMKNPAPKRAIIVGLIFSLGCVVITILNFCNVRKIEYSRGIIVSGLFFLLYVLLFCWRKHVPDKLKDFTKLISLMVILELVLNGVFIYHGVDEEIGFKNYSKIYQKQKVLERQLQEINDNSLGYRIEKNYRVAYNDGFAFGYNSISSFSSVYNIGVHDFLRNMGVMNQLWNSSYQGSTTFVDSVLGIKYILHSVRKSDLIFSNGKKDLIEKNEFTLPLGFMVSQDILDYELDKDYSLSPMEKQQELLAAITGDEESKKCFQSFEPDKIICKNLQRTFKNGRYILKAEGKEEDGECSITYKVIGDGEKEYYFYPRFNYNEHSTRAVEVSTLYNTEVNSHYVEVENLSIPFNIRLFDSPNKTEDEVTFKFHKKEKVILEDELFYFFDKKLYGKYYDKLLKQGLSIDEFSDGFLKGNVEVEKEGIFLLTAPYNLKWSVYVDGKKTKIIPICNDTFIGVKLEPGNHTIIAKYEDTSIKIGIIVSAVSFLLLGVILIYVFKRRNLIQ